MPVNKIYIILLLGFLCGSCVTPYEPELDESQEVLVISGMITDRSGLHKVTVSRSSPYRLPEFQGLESCVVTVTNQDGDIIVYADAGEGIYEADVPDDFLDVGDAASLYVMTPNQREYQSSYDTILACPDIDSIYYELGTLEAPDPEFNRPGIQLYLDMSGEDSDCRNVIWRVQETWEYWVSLFGTHIMHSWREMEEFRSNVLYKCWKSYPLDQIYTGTTRNLSENELLRVPLNFVSNETDRLSVTYSLYVQQQSLSLETYDYWQRMNDQAAESGGMYEKQPASVQGNIYNLYNPDDVVLGCFYASQIREQRIFVKNNGLFDFWIPHISCEYEPTSTLWAQYGSPDVKFPVYIYDSGPFMPKYWGPQECFDCRLQGGDTIRPLIWESW